MKLNSGSIINCVFTANSCWESNNGTRAVTKIIIMIIMLNAIIRYLNFNLNSPIITLQEIIKESAFYVNEPRSCAAETEAGRIE